MDPPPPLASVTSAANQPHSTLSNSISSSPQSRSTDEDSLPPITGVSKLRLICSYGGHIIPRPHDKSLCYVGGDTRMVVVDRNVTLTNLFAKVSKTLGLKMKVFGLKYQLPNEDLDSLISIAGDEDLENMVEEYDRICAGGKCGSRLRLFVFPVKLESVNSIGSLLDSSVQSDECFLNALNGLGVLSNGFSDSASVNCLLGLEDDFVVASNNNGNELGVSSGLDAEFANGGKNVKISNQDVHSMPDSPMMETTSSYGSANSTRLMEILPPIKVREDDGGVRVQDQQFVQQTSLSPALENFAAMPPIPTTIISSMPVQSTVVVSSGQVVQDFQNKVMADDASSDHGDMVGFGRKSPQLQSQVQLQQMQPRPGGSVDSSPRPDLFPSDGSIMNATPRSDQIGYQEVIQVSGENRIPANTIDSRNNLIDTITNNAPVQLQKPMQGSGYLVQQPQIETHHYPYPQQFVRNGIHYVVQQPGNPMGMPAYYPAYPPQQVQQHPNHQPIQFQPQQYQHPVYIVQASPPPQGYNMPIVQHTYPESSSVVHAGNLQTPLNPNRVPDSAKAFSNSQNVSRAPPNLEVPSTIYRTTSVAAQPIVQVAPNLPQPQFVNYSQVNQQHQVTSAPNPTYSYELSDPSRAQIYYTQPLAPSLISQYQTMSSARVLEAASDQPQPQNDSMKPSQIKSS